MVSGEIDWIWKLCNIDFESDIVPEDWRYAENALLYKGKEEMTEWEKYRYYFVACSWKNIFRDISGQSP